MEEVKDNLVVEEYKYVRDMIKTNIDIMEKNESLILVSMAAIYGFFLKDFNFDSGIFQISSAIPLFLSIIGFIRYNALNEVIGIYNNYINKLEEKYPDSIGWTRFYRAEKLSQNKKLLKDSRDTLWWALMIGSCMIFVGSNVGLLIKSLCK